MPAIDHLIGNITFPSTPDDVHLPFNFNDIAAFFSNLWSNLLEFLSHPSVQAAILAWLITFSIILFVTLSLGFGPAGIVAGSLAAAFQGMVYGAFTPAGGLFAVMTSLAMTGWIAFPFAILAGGIATIVAAIVWVFYAGI